MEEIRVCAHNNEGKFRRTGIMKYKISHYNKEITKEMGEIWMIA